MKTLFSLFILGVVGVVANFVWVFIGNLAGLPGALLAGLSPTRPPWRYWLGSIIAFLGQAYVGLAFAAWVSAWTRLAVRRPDVLGLILWPVAFLAVAAPMWIGLIRARVEAREDRTPPNPQIEALHFTVLAVIFGFVLFAVFPGIAAAAWPWVPLVPAAAGG